MSIEPNLTLCCHETRLAGHGRPPKGVVVPSCTSSSQSVFIGSGGNDRVNSIHAGFIRNPSQFILSSPQKLACRGKSASTGGAVEAAAQRPAKAHPRSPGSDRHAGHLRENRGGGPRGKAEDEEWQKSRGLKIASRPAVPSCRAWRNNARAKSKSGTPSNVVC